MPAELLLMNPRRKKRAKRTRSVSRRRRRTTARKVTRRRRKAVGYVAGHARVRRRKLNPRHRRAHARVGSRRRRRHNPRLGGLSLGGLKHTIVPALIGGVGAIALDVAFSYIPLPASLSTGYVKTGVKLAGAIGLGFVAGKVLGRERGKAVALGALTVVLYGAVKDLIKQYAPSVPGLAGDYQDMRVGAYMPSLGGMNPAPMLQGLGAYMASPGPLQSLQRMQMGCVDDGM